MSVAGFFRGVVVMTRADRPVPSGLSEASAALWPRLVTDLRDTSGVAEVDLLLLEDVLRAMDRLATVREVLATDGITVTGSKDQIRPHPLLVTESVLRRDIAAGFERLKLAPNRRLWDVSVTPTGRLKSGR